MAEASARPTPLRVAVGEVVARTSLVTPIPPEVDGPAVLAVVQRAVRIISDPPPGNPLGGATVIDDLRLASVPDIAEDLELGIAGDTTAVRAMERPPRDSVAEAPLPLEATAMVVDVASLGAPPSAPAGLVGLAESVPPAEGAELPAPALAEATNLVGAPALADELEPDLSPDAPIAAFARAIDAALADASSLRESAEPPADAVDFSADDDVLARALAYANDGAVTLELDKPPRPETPSASPPPDDGGAAQGGASQSYIDELSEEALAEALTEDSSDDDVDMDAPTLPPPAPPEALRRSSPGETGTPVPPKPAPASTPPGQMRPSGEFEELEMEVMAEVRATQQARAARTAGPPPPPPARASMPDVETPSRPRVEDLRPTRPRTQSWWETFFDDDYLRTVRPPTREQVVHQVEFIERRLGLRPGASLLDVGCGLGLQVLELNARGYVGVGLDLSLPMLTRASEEAQTRGVRVNFLHGDMREMVFEAAFDAVICMGTTFGYFDDETNRRVLERLYRALKPGGALMIDVVNRDHVLPSQPNLVWFEGEGCVCMEETEINFFTSRLHVKRTVIHDTGKQTDNEYAMRLYSLHELGQMLNAAGFRVVEVSGRDTVPGVFFGHESPNLIIVAQRRVAAEAPAAPATEG
jgi:SAM-dependent methyltransferase